MRAMVCPGRCENRFAVGDELELITPEGNKLFRLQLLLDEKGGEMSVAPGGGYHVQVQLPTELQTDKGLLTRVL